MKNFVKEKLKNGEISVGTFASIAHPEIPEMLSSVGFEWILFDAEHGPISIETIQNLMQAIDLRSCIPLIRVAWNDPVLIKRALDIGAYGILVPWVNSAEEAKKAVEACRYPPRGIRGFGPRRCSAYGLKMKEYLNTVEDELMIIMQIETMTAVKNIEEIVHVDGVDAIFIGPGDLSISINGISKMGETVASQEFREILERIVKVSTDAGVSPGCGCDIIEFKERVDQGFKFIDVMCDEILFLYGCQTVMKQVKEHL